MTAPLILRAYIRRDWAIARSYRFQGLMEFVWWSLELVLFYALGGLVDQTGGNDSSIIGGDYFTFVVAGIALRNVSTKILHTFASVIRTEQVTGSLEAVMMVPRSGPFLILASSSYGILQALIQMALFLLTGALLFGFRISTAPSGLVASLVVLFVSLVTFVGAGVVIAAFALVIKQVNALVEIASYALAILGGVFVPVPLLPEPLPVIAKVFPFTWAVELFRRSLLEGDVSAPQLLTLSLFAFVFLAAALWILGKAVDRARRDGTLAQY